MTHHTDTDTTPTELTVKRDGDVDLEFEGVQLGEGEHGTGGEFRSDWTRGTLVRLYRTAGGRYVLSVKAWTRWQGEFDSHRAAVLDDPSDVLEWLREDAGGHLGRASKEALEAASLTDDGLAAVAVERVE